MKLRCPRCSSFNLVRTQKSILDGRWAYGCQDCRTSLAPPRSGWVLGFFFLFSLICLLTGLGVLCVYAQLGAVRVPWQFIVWPIAAAAAMVVILIELLRPKPVRVPESEFPGQHDDYRPQ